METKGEQFCFLTDEYRLRGLFEEAPVPPPPLAPPPTLLVILESGTIGGAGGHPGECLGAVGLAEAAELTEEVMVEKVRFRDDPPLAPLATAEAAAADEAADSFLLFTTGMAITPRGRRDFALVVEGPRRWRGRVSCLERYRACTLRPSLRVRPQASPTHEPRPRRLLPRQSIHSSVLLVPALSARCSLLCLSRSLLFCARAPEPAGEKRARSKSFSSSVPSCPHPSTGPLARVAPESAVGSPSAVRPQSVPVPQSAVPSQLSLLLVLPAHARPAPSCCLLLFLLVLVLFLLLRLLLLLLLAVAVVAVVVLLFTPAAPFFFRPPDIFRRRLSSEIVSVAKLPPSTGVFSASISLDCVRVPPNSRSLDWLHGGAELLIELRSSSTALSSVAVRWSWGDFESVSEIASGRERVGSARLPLSLWERDETTVGVRRASRAANRAWEPLSPLTPSN